MKPTSEMTAVMNAVEASSVTFYFDPSGRMVGYEYYPKENNMFNQLSVVFILGQRRECHNGHERHDAFDAMLSAGARKYSSWDNTRNGWKHSLTSAICV